jgi:hypothetical protein
LNVALVSKSRRISSVPSHHNLETEDTKTGLLDVAIGQTKMGRTFKLTEYKKNQTMSWNSAAVKADTFQETKLPAKPLVSMAGLKLVLPDEHITQPQEKKVNSNTQLNASKEGFGRRILIEQPKESKTQPIVQQILIRSTNINEHPKK